MCPDALKIARVDPVYKNGDKLVGSYGKIAIIPVFDTIMKVQLLNYFEANNLFCEAQHGFRSCHAPGWEYR